MRNDHSVYGKVMQHSDRTGHAASMHMPRVSASVGSDQEFLVKISSTWQNNRVSPRILSFHRRKQLRRLLNVSSNMEMFLFEYFIKRNKSKTH